MQRCHGVLQRRFGFSDPSGLWIDVVEQIEQRARLIVSRMEAQLPPERLAALAGSVDTESVRALFDLIAATGYPDTRHTQALEREFLTAINRWRLSE